MLEFCPMCKKLLVQKEYKGNLVGACSCGFIRTGGINISGEENNSICFKGGGIVEENNLKKEGLDRICKKCGYQKAEAHQIVSNESDITIYTCLKCGTRTRESSGASKA